MRKMYGILALAMLLCMMTACAEKKTEEKPVEQTIPVQTQEAATQSTENTTASTEETVPVPTEAKRPPVNGSSTTGPANGTGTTNGNNKPQNNGQPPKPADPTVPAVGQVQADANFGSPGADD